MQRSGIPKISIGLLLTRQADWQWIAMAEYGEDWTGGMGGTASVQLDSVKKMCTMEQGSCFRIPLLG